MKDTPAQAIVTMGIMASTLRTEPFVVSADSLTAGLTEIKQSDPSPDPADAGNSWNLATMVALFLLVVLWAWKLYTTWGAWGNLTIDSGHEMYIPALLAQGKQLYRDVWYMYGPGAPYLTSYLYRLFGVKLDVLYWAGSLSALGSAIFLYLTGMRLSHWAVGWAAGAVVLMEAFQPSLFCFPLPYASAAVYGCLTGCLFLWLAVSACYSKGWFFIFCAGTAAALAGLLKPEFGMACYGTMAILIAGRAWLWRSWKLTARDIAAILPGLMVCGFVIRWMVSIRGVEFITQENIVSWPTSYFMKSYGKMWLEKTGFTVSGAALWEASQRAIPVAAVLLATYIFLRWRRYDTRSVLLRLLIVMVLLLYFAKHNFFLLAFEQAMTLWLSTIFFPRDMVLYVVLSAALAWCYFWWRPATARNLALPILLTYSSLLAFRILMMMRPADYSIYYNGPVVLSFLLVLVVILTPSNRSRRFGFPVELALCLACLTPVWFNTQALEGWGKRYVPLTTDRGTVRAPEALVKRYEVAIQFMKERAASGQTVLSIPEDTSLYFLSGTLCPIRVFSFTPGVLAPGKMTDETIQQIDQTHVDYLLWSNRTFFEFGVPIFGQDFDREVGDYLKSHYRPVGPLYPTPPKIQVWSADIWKRDPNSGSR